MTGIKVCGLTTMDDISAVNELEPDYIGFVFAPSKRRIRMDYAKTLSKSLSPKIKRVGVFVNASRDVIMEHIKVCQLDIVQLHGDESPEDCLNYPCYVWKAFRVRGLDILGDINNYKVEGILLDAYAKGVYGGAGQSFNWEAGAGIKGKKVILAGGLNTGNVAGAIEVMRPEVVDVSSGVEVNGKKHYAKIKLFIEIVRGIKHE